MYFVVEESIQYENGGSGENIIIIILKVDPPLACNVHGPQNRIPMRFSTTKCIFSE